MAVNGSYMAWRVQSCAIRYVEAYGGFVLNDVLSGLGNLERRAEEIANAEFARLGSEPVYGDCDVDMGSLAEEANDKGLAFYETMSSLRQTTLNLFTVGLFHLVEQQLANLCDDGAYTVFPPRESKLDIVRKWYQPAFPV